MELPDILDRKFDVVVIGAGINGSSAAQYLTAAGYSVLIVDKNDFSSGASGRSSRLLHCGLRYLEQGSSMMDIVSHPSRFKTIYRMATQAMESRSQFVKTTPERAREMRFHFPIYKDDKYAGWQIDAAFKLLRTLGPIDPPLDYERIKGQRMKNLPFLRDLKNQSELVGAAVFREYQFDWPERVVVDNILDMERMGGVAFNYTSAAELRRSQDTWDITLKSNLGNDAHEDAISVQSKIILNMAGTWIDSVNQSALGKRHRKYVTGTKGAHIAVKLSEDYQGMGLASLNRKGEPIYCVPWRNIHYIGPTETLFEGDAGDATPNETEIQWLLAETNDLLPGLKLSRADVIYAWAGVRPLTHDPDNPMGARSREFHDLGDDGLPNCFCLTAGPVMTHRSAGAEALDMVSRLIKPSRDEKQMSFRSSSLFDSSNNDYSDDKEINSDLAAACSKAVTTEHAKTLTDVMFRRLGLGWNEDMGLNMLRPIATSVGNSLGWDDATLELEIAKYERHISKEHAYRIPARPSHA